MKQLRPLALVSLLTAFPAGALADVVGPPPDSCPAGSRGNSCHGGPFCEPRSCSDDTECSAGQVCQDTPICLGSINCAGLIPPDADPNDFLVPTVEASCAGGAACPSGACETRRLCVAVGGAEDDGGCSATSRPPHGAWWPLALLAAVVALRRRRR